MYEEKMSKRYRENEAMKIEGKEAEKSAPGEWSGAYFYALSLRYTRNMPKTNVCTAEGSL